LLRRDPRTALRTFAIVGGVAAYAREMVDGDLPEGPEDFDRWVCRRVLSPSAPLSTEVGLLLSEDPSTSRARKVNLYHAALVGVATGHHAHGKLTGYVKIPGASLAPIVAASGGDLPAARTVLAIGEARAGERLALRHLRRLEEARSALGDRGAEPGSCCSVWTSTPAWRTRPQPGTTSS
jgi:hypothetical protein